MRWAVTMRCVAEAKHRVVVLSSQAREPDCIRLSPAFQFGRY
ncbi:hypothetical protein RISK_003385 [Rhodopirellula islandica]|uniref:Uncharacterized protein n=1 Tax=Rhodopirellula islandica TaxID=595434 RepID=A0A0J1BCT4_RHOIS|nr:hypothetical protein RISK_003385 [Rhodopirellula islandica]